MPTTRSGIDQPVMTVGAERLSSLSLSHECITHPETWMERDELGRVIPPYRPTVPGFRQFINDRHRYFHECPTNGILIDVAIQGHLRREDALKLYEMAYYAPGDILEFGTSYGLSTSILAGAVRDAGKNSALVTMELDAQLAERARRTLSELDLSRHIEFLVGDADVSCQKLIDAGRKFNLAFVDHSHAYDDVVKACRRLYQLLVPGSFCLFHDYNDSREGTAAYGVYTAVTHTLDKNEFEFCGIYGCCGLFHRVKPEVTTPLAKLNHESQEVLGQDDQWLAAQEIIAKLCANKTSSQGEIENALSELRNAIAKAQDQRRAAHDQQKGLEEKLNVQLATIKKRDERIEGLKDQRKALEEKLDAQLATIKERDQRIIALEAKENAQAATLRELERRIQEETHQRAKLDDLLRAALKHLSKLGKWSDRLLNEYKRVLESNRWRIGCWLSFKRADQKSKEAQGLTQLLRSRPLLPNIAKQSADDPTAPQQSEPQQSPNLALDINRRDPSGGCVQPASIIIPVYNAHDELIQCVESVRRHSRPVHRVILIDDASTDERIWPLLQSWASLCQNFCVARNDSNLGYTATVNRGCELAGVGDVILLNSDTIVPAHWIEQMAACAYSRPRVATVTAISNAAGAFSVPRKNAINDLPSGWSLNQMAALVERTSQRIRPAVPTGNGFCMYITSVARAAVGSFDAEHFPSGYGEENDYCLRASAAGLVNLIDDATYVFHRRSASFGPAKEEILKRSEATLDQLHPHYTRLIREWSQMDALDPIREDMQRRIDVALSTGIDGALPRDERPCLLLVLPDGAEGNRNCVEDLNRAMAKCYRVIVLRAALDNWSIDQFFDNRLTTVRCYPFAERSSVDAPITADRLAVLDEICADHKVDLAHVHALLASRPDLVTRLRQLNVPIAFSFPDLSRI